jgi:hypothetical protein
MENELNSAIDFSVTTATKEAVMQQVAYNSSSRVRSEEKDQFSFVELIISALVPCK